LQPGSEMRRTTRFVRVLIAVTSLQVPGVREHAARHDRKSPKTESAAKPDRIRAS